MCTIRPRTILLAWTIETGKTLPILQSESAIATLNKQKGNPILLLTSKLNWLTYSIPWEPLKVNQIDKRGEQAWAKIQGPK